MFGWVKGQNVFPRAENRWGGMKPCPLVNHRLALRTTQGIPIRLTAERCSPMVFMQHRGQAVSTGGLLLSFLGQAAACLVSVQ